MRMMICGDWLGTVLRVLRSALYNERMGSRRMFLSRVTVWPSWATLTSRMNDVMRVTMLATVVGFAGSRCLRSKTVLHEQGW
jgi:hypothetical protein